MKYFFDTEFVEDGDSIDLISIGIVAEDGREYYAISSEFDRKKAYRHPFVASHVLPQVYAENAPVWRDRFIIAREIREFVGKDPEFWADYASYDWIALCQLFGTMMQLPDTWPMFCCDVQQLRCMIGASPFEANLLEADEHNALNDARECKARFDMLKWVAESNGIGVTL